MFAPKDGGSAAPGPAARGDDIDGQDLVDRILAGVATGCGFIVVAADPTSLRASVLARVAAGVCNHGDLYRLNDPPVVSCRPDMRLAEVVARCTFDRRAAARAGGGMPGATAGEPVDLVAMTRTRLSAVVILDHGEVLTPTVWAQLRRWQRAFQSVRGPVAIVAGVEAVGAALPAWIDQAHDTIVAMPGAPADAAASQPVVRRSAQDHRDAAPCRVAGGDGGRRRLAAATLTLAAVAVVGVVYLAGLPAIQAPAAEAPATPTTVSVATGDGGGAGVSGAAVVDVLAQADGPSRTEEPAQRGATEGPTASTGPERFVMPAPPGDSPIGRPWEAATAAAYEAARAAAQTTAAGEPATAPVIETPHQPEPAAPALDGLAQRPETAEPVPDRASADEPAAGALAVTALLDRGNAMLELGDVASARLFFRRAADAGSGQGALLMGVTYDPVTFSRLGITGTRPHPRDAVTWYRTAQSLGVTEADSRLSALRRWLALRAGEGDAEAAAILDSLP